MPSIHRHIWNKLGIKGGDSLPMTGAPWNMRSTRTTIAEIMALLGFKIGAEIGVERGVFSRVLCDTIPGLKLICVDPWKAYHHNSQDREDHLYRRTVERLAGCNVEIMRMSSIEAAKIIPNNSLDFVYIDALHEFDNVMIDIILWANKVRAGGIIAGHDFVNYYQYGVVQAVTTYTQVHGIVPWYVTTGEKENSWFWVKQ